MTQIKVPDNRLHELLEFPCSLTYKVVGDKNPNLMDQVVQVVQKIQPSNYTPTSKPSRNGNFESISITVKVENIKQVETLYKKLAEIECVRMVL